MTELQIIYQDDDLVVIDKPSGLIVNKSATAKEVTLQDLVLDKGLINLPTLYGEESVDEFASRAGIVHRLDKETSGVILVARNALSFAKLQKQFKDRTVCKEYIALVVGKVPDAEFEINAPIKRNPSNRLKFSVSREGKEAITRGVVLGYYDQDVLTLLKLFPKSGRTHQIRVHLSAYGHPVVGDSLYCSKKLYNTWHTQFLRLMLHAYKISFIHPTLNMSVNFCAPLPIEFDIVKGVKIENNNIC